ncbi:recombination regulator RecX [Streptomyces sp. S.PB5]|uniref:recombination regulator RecX n=1 Tax=Streptomyces sp. S.PB5 TaxID=3020844 RepID=UPI0025B22F07|nr:recombination regulator RecX [Streptomyces sp. S.PB5]MDN3021260.1 recombination regulator RecX [Streptomyces sp. S.PB5]
MTRRTDWAEYAYQDALRERGRAGDGGSAGPGGDAHGDGTYGDGADWGHGRAASYGSGGSYGAGGSYGDGGARGDGGTHGADPPYGRDSSYGHEPPFGGERPYGGEPGGGEWSDDGAADGSAVSGGRSRRGGGRARGGRGSGAGGSRGRRQRRGDGPPDMDGGASSSSRAEQGEPSGDPVERARGICLRLLTGTPRTRKQLADALSKKGIPDEAAEEVLSRFEEVGLINDSAFADAWVESRHHGRGLARRALAQELRTKGVDSTLIDAAVSQLDSEQEEATARELVDRKLRSTRGLDRDKRLRRLAGMLARKGYPEGMALRVVRQALEAEGEDAEFLEDEGF